MKSEFGARLFLAMSWGGTIGGIATFLGGNRAPLALAILESTSNTTIGFFERCLFESSIN